MSEDDRMITSFAYLKVMSPKGMVNRTSKATNDHTEWTLKMELKMVLTRAQRINPKTKLNLNVTCTNEKYRHIYQPRQSIGSKRGY